jgi:hypothetical protein
MTIRRHFELPFLPSRDFSCSLFLADVLSESPGPAYNGGEHVAADFACKTIDPNNPTGPKIDAIFPYRGLTWKSTS